MLTMFIRVDRQKTEWCLSFFTLIFLSLVVFLNDAYAVGQSNTAWDTPLDSLLGALEGPVAYTISLLAIFVCGATLAFGGEMHEFARRLIMVVLVVALIMTARTFLESAFDISATVDGYVVVHIESWEGRQHV